MIYAFFQISDNGPYKEGMLLSVLDTDEQIPGFVVGDNNFKKFAVVEITKEQKAALRPLCNPVYAEPVVDEEPIIKSIRSHKIELASLVCEKVTLEDLKNPEKKVSAVKDLAVEKFLIGIE